MISLFLHWIFPNMTVHWLSDSYFCFSLFSLSSNSVSVCIVGHSLFLIIHSVQPPKLSPFRHKLLPIPSTSKCMDTLTEGWRQNLSHAPHPQYFSFISTFLIPFQSEVTHRFSTLCNFQVQFSDYTYTRTCTQFVCVCV